MSATYVDMGDAARVVADWRAGAGGVSAFTAAKHYALEHGIYLPPSAYETCFISAAHTNLDLEKTANVLVAGLRAL